MRARYAGLHAQGFSLVELLASAAILGLLASVAIPFIETTVKRQKEHELRIALREIRQGIDAYKLASAGGHVAVVPGASGYPPSLDELVRGVADIAPPGGRTLYFLRRIPRDPFYPNPAVAPIETWGKRSFDSPPDVPHEGDDVFDVYSQSTARGLNGVPYVEW